jgi:hypothetical protein
MPRPCPSRTIAAAILGVCIGVPCRAWSGPDFCTGYFFSSESAHLTLTSRSIDGVSEAASARDGGVVTGDLASLGNDEVVLSVDDDQADRGHRSFYLYAASR